MNSDRLRRETAFGSWLSGYGIRPLCHELGEAGFPITEHAAYGWLAGRTTPRLEVAIEVQRISGGTVTVEDIRAHRVQISFRQGKR